MRPEVYRQCMAVERAAYLASGQPSKVIAVDEELARIGWVVDSATGELVELDKVTRSVKKPAAVRPPVERAVPVPAERAVDKS